MSKPDSFKARYNPFMHWALRLRSAVDGKEPSSLTLGTDGYQDDLSFTLKMSVGKDKRKVSLKLSPLNFLAMLYNISECAETQYVNGVNGERKTIVVSDFIFANGNRSTEKKKQGAVTVGRDKDGVITIKVDAGSESVTIPMLFNSTMAQQELTLRTNGNDAPKHAESTLFTEVFLKAVYNGYNDVMTVGIMQADLDDKYGGNGAGVKTISMKPKGGGGKGSKHAVPDDDDIPF